LRSEEPVVEARPDYLLNPTPPYPALARKRGYEGKVIIEVLVDEKGFPSEIKIAESSGHAILDNAAAEAVDAWKFEPARRGTVPLPMRVKVPILFKLD
jgi:protein TonB